MFCNVSTSTRPEWHHLSPTVELTSLNRRYETHRMREPAREARRLASIASRGIQQPLEGVDTPEGRFLLNGFKRLRCARQLSLGCVPYVSIADDEATGILHLMRVERDHTLNLLEQAKFVVELLTIQRMSVAEVAQTLSRSKSWVSLRQELLREMCQDVEAILLRGDFPVSSYLYTLRSFRRMNSLTPADIARFLKAVAGRGLSVRDIDLLAQAYFRGPSSLREAIAAGNVTWSLEQMKHLPGDPDGCSPFERRFLGDLEMLRGCLQRVLLKCRDQQPRSRAFRAQANLLSLNLLSNSPLFVQSMEQLRDRSGQA